MYNAPQGLGHVTHLSILLLASLTGTAQLPSDSVAQLPLADTCTLLNGRMTLVLPNGFDREELPAGLVDPWSDPGALDHVRMSAGGRSVFILCQELYASAGKSLLQDWRTVIDPGGDGGYRLAKARTQGLEGVVYHVMDPAPGQGYSLVQGAVLHGSDGALIWLQMYLPAQALPELQGYATLLDRVVATASSGPNPLAVQQRTALIGLFGGKDSLAIDLPAGYVLVNRNTGLQVGYRIHQLAPLLNAPLAELAIVHGAGPTPLSKAMELDEGQRTRVPGTLMNHAIEWEHFVDQDGAVRIMEVQEPGISNGIVQVSLIAATQEGLDKLIAIASTVRKPR